MTLFTLSETMATALQRELAATTEELAAMRRERINSLQEQIQNTCHILDLMRAADAAKKLLADAHWKTRAAERKKQAVEWLEDLDKTIREITRTSSPS